MTRLMERVFENRESWPICLLAADFGACGLRPRRGLGRVGVGPSMGVVTSVSDGDQQAEVVP